MMKKIYVVLSGVMWWGEPTLECAFHTRTDAEEYLYSIAEEHLLYDWYFRSGQNTYEQLHYILDDYDIAEVEVF